MSRGLKTILVLFVLLLAAGVAVRFSFDPDSLKPRIIAAVARATGRALTIDGRIHLQLLPRPAVTADGIVLGNRPGGSPRPMATVQTIAADVAWLPLLSGRVDIDSLTLVRPDILLETDPDGIGNWVFTRPVSAPSSAPATSSGVRLQTSIDRVVIRDGHLLWRDQRPNHDVAIDIPSLAAEAGEARTTFAGTLQAHGTPIRINATTGSLDRLDAPGGTPWPVDVTLAAVGGKGSLQGTISDPLRGRMYDATLAASLPALESLNGIFPYANLPPLHDVRLSAHVSNAGAQLPLVSDASLQAGASDLAGLHSGLVLANLRITLPTPNDRIALQASGSLNQVPLGFTGAIGSAAALVANQPVGLSFAGQLGGSTLSLDGSLADPRHGSGIDAKVTLNAPDLAAVAQAFPGLPLPMLNSLAVSSRVVTTSPNQVVLRGLALHTLQGDVAGDLTLNTVGRPQLSGQLVSNYLDLDALAAVPIRPSPMRPAAPAPLTAPPAPAPLTAPPAPAPLTAPPRPPLPAAAPPGGSMPPSRSATIISDAPLPFALMRLADADITLSARQVIWRHTTLAKLATHITLAHSRFSLDPFSVSLGGGTIAATLKADASEATPPVALTLQARSVPAESLMVLAGEPPSVTGILDARAQLQGTGETPHALAGSLDGRVGMTLVNGQIEAGPTGAILAPLLQSAGAPPGLASQAGRARSDVRCFALAATLSHGTAEIGTLLLDSAALEVSGTGTVQLGAETLDLRLHPQLRLGGNGIAVPVRLTGPWRAPKTAWDGPVDHGKASFSAVIGALTQTGPAEDCGPALAAARDGVPGMAPAAAVKAKVPNLGDLLKGLAR